MTVPEETGSGATAALRADGDGLVLDIGGDWRLRASRPDHRDVLESSALREKSRMVVSLRNLGFWDSSLALFLLGVKTEADKAGVACDMSALPSVLERWIEALETSPTPETESGRRGWRFPVLTWIGTVSTGSVRNGRDMLAFLGQCVVGALQWVAHPSGIRWSDLFLQMRRSGAQALGIVGLITFLVGVILAFVAAMQLRQFGADIYVANLIGLAMFREMGPMMAAIVLAGRTGAAYAAELGNMRLNEEIDALETFGVSAMSFLVMPRMMALVVMMPMLALYADFLGVIGGMLVAKGTLGVPMVAFVRQLEESVRLTDVFSGLIKSVFFGVVVAYAGCLKGMKAERSAVGVGEATTAAVVLGILLIIIADAVFTVVFDAIGF